MSVNLGPVSPTLAEVGVVATGAGSAYNPRCLKRDVSVWVSSQWNTDQNSTDLVTQNTDVGSFQTTMQGDFATGFYG
jgi:tyrosinase